MFDTLKILLDARLAKMEERGASAVEYGLLIAGIAALIIAVVFVFGGTITRRLQRHLRHHQEQAAPAAAPADPGFSWAADVTSAAHGRFRPRRMAHDPPAVLT